MRAVAGARIVAPSVCARCKCRALSGRGADGMIHARIQAAPIYYCCIIIIIIIRTIIISLHESSRLDRGVNERGGQRQRPAPNTIIIILIIIIIIIIIIITLTVA